MSLGVDLVNWAAALPVGFDFVAGELVKLLLSDASTASVEQLTSRPGLWVRNALIHSAAGFVGYFMRVHWPRSEGWLHWAFNAYWVLQFVQFFLSPGSKPVLFLDGALDILVLLVGYWFACFVAMRSVPVFKWGRGHE